MVEKAIDKKVKASLRLSSRTKKINSRYLKSYKPLAKKEKNKTSKEY